MTEIPTAALPVDMPPTADEEERRQQERDQAAQTAAQQAAQQAFAPPGEVLVAQANPGDEAPPARPDVQRGGDRQKDVPPPAARLTGESAEAARRVQDMLIKYAYMFVSIEPIKDEKAEDTAKRYDKALADKIAQLEKQKQDGVFGPESQEAYKLFVLKMQELVPGAVAELSRMQIPVPPGCPIEVPRDKYNMILQPELFRKMVTNGEITCDLGIDTRIAPNFEALNKLESVLRFQGICTLWSKEAHDKLVDDGLINLIKRNGLPEKWAQQGDMDPEAWRHATKQMTEFAINFRNLVEAGYQLKQTDKYSSFDFQLPPGVTVKDGKPVFPPEMLPQDLRLSSPRNQELIAAMERWMQEYGPKVMKAHEEANKSALHTWADQPFGAGAKVVFDKDNNFIGIFPNTYVPDAAKGEKALDGNCFKHRYEVTEVNGEIKVKQTLQVQSVPAMGWQDWIAFDVGKEFTTEHTYKKDAFVRISDSGKVMMCKAEDLQYFKNVQRGWYYGTKIVMTALDVALLFTGFAEVSAGIRAASIAARSAQVAAAAGKAAFTFTTREALMQIGRGALRATVGFLGVFNNSWGATNDIGIAINRARHAYFLFDITRSLIPGRVTGLLPNTPLSGFARVGEKFDAAMKQTNFMWGAPKYLHGSFRVSEWAMLPLLGRDGMRTFGGPCIPHMDYASQLIEGSHLVDVPDPKPDLKKPEQLAAARKTMDSWATLLGEGKPQDKKDEIKAIIDKTKELMDPNKPEAERVAFRNELITKATLGEKTLQSIQQYIGRKLTAEELHNASARSRWDKLPAFVKSAVRACESEVDHDVRSAANIALLYLSMKDGVIEGNLAQGKVMIGEHSWTEEGAETSYDMKLTEHSLDLTLTAADVAEMLKHELAKAPEQLVSRGVAAADAMFRCGALTGPEFATVLQDVLRCPTATKEQKMRALSDNGAPRYVDLIESMTRLEQMVAGASAQDVSRAQTLAGDSSARNLKMTLEEMAAKDADPDLRALAASLLHGLREREALSALALDIDNLRKTDPTNMTEERLRKLKELFGQDGMKAAFLDRNNLLSAEQLSKGQGKYAEEAKKALKTIMAADIPDDCTPEQAHIIRERKVSAALSYMMLEKGNWAKTEAGTAIADAIIDSPDLAVLRAEPANKHLYQRYLDLVVRASAQLTPDVMQALPAEKAKQLRAKLVEVLNTPASDLAEGRAMTDLVRSLRTIMTADTDKAALVSKLQGMIDPRQAGKYALAFPELRAEAITTLAAFGHRDSLDLIRGRTTATPMLSLGDKNIPAGETDARVRLAAVMALETLTDERLGDILSKLVTTEKDVTAQDKVRALMTRHTSPTIDAQAAYRDAYSKRYQDTMTSLKRDWQYTLVDKMKDQDIPGWVSSNNAIKLLNRDVWYTDRMARAEQVRKDWGNWDYFWSYAKTIHDGMDSKGIKASDDARDDLWGRFARLARGDMGEFSPADLMPAVDAAALKAEVAAANDAEIAAIKQRQQGNAQATKECNDKITTLRQEIETEQARVRQAVARLQADDTARELLQRQSSDLLVRKQQEIEGHERRIADIKAEEATLAEDLRKAEGIKRMIDRGLNLADETTQKEVAAALAKRQIFLILQGGGGVEGTPDQENAHWHKEHYKYNVHTKVTTTAQWQIRAADALAACLQEGSMGRAQAAWYVKQALTSTTLSLPAEARTTLLNAWRDLAKVSPDRLRDQLSLTEDQVAAVTLQALEVELGRAEGNQSKAHQIALINDLLTYRYRPALAVLEGISDSGKYSKAAKEVKDLAKSVFDQLRDGTTGHWDRTVADTSADGPTRAARLRERMDAYTRMIDPSTPMRRGAWVDAELAADQLVQSIFNNYKGYQFKNAAEMDTLLPLLDAPHDKIRLAAAKALLQGTTTTEGAGSARQKALQALAAISIDGKQSQYRKDAKNELNAFAAENSPLSRKDEWKGTSCDIQVPTTDGSKKVITLQRHAGGAVSVIETTNGFITGIVNGAGNSRRFMRDNGIVNVMVENGVHYARQKDERGRYSREWILDGDAKRKWFGEVDVTSDGVYSWWSANGKETSIVSPSGTVRTLALERAGGLVTAIQYPDVRDAEDVVSRSFKRQGEELIEMTYYRKGNPHPIIATRLKNADGQYIDSWTISCHVGSTQAGWTPRTMGPWSGKLTVDDRGNYRFDGNGYSESHSADGKLYVTRAEDFVPDS